MSENFKIYLIDKNRTTFDKLNEIGCTNIEYSKNIDKALNDIKKIKFSEIRIIINGKLYAKFAEKYFTNITEFFSIPKLVIFTENEELFLKENKDITKNSFFKFVQIITTYEDLKNFINGGIFNQKFEINEEPALTFQYIEKHYELALHLFYKVLIELTDIEKISLFTNKIYNEYQEKCHKIRTLLGPIQNMKYIPIELLAKYYARTYTADCGFYKDMNTYLRENTKNENEYLPYIKLLYESIILKTFPLVKEKELFRGSLLSNEEIEKIKKIDENKKADLPGMVLFSRTFLSFSKDKKIVLKNFWEKPNEESNLTKVLFILEKEEDSVYSYSLATHADIENLSYFEKEREVLFFPFSSFEVLGCTDKNENNELFYEINLKYLGKKYVDVIEKHIKEKEEERKKEIEMKQKEEEEKKKEEQKNERIEEEKKEEEKEEEKKEEEKKEEVKEEEKKEEVKEEEKKEEVKEEEKKTIEIENDKTNKNQDESNTIKNILEMEKIEDFEFKKQITESGLINLQDITSIEELFQKYKKYRKKIKKYNSAGGSNYIKGKIYINDFNVNKKVKIISSFEQYGEKYYSIKIEDLELYKNAKEIKRNTKIKINNKEIQFSFFHRFIKKGEYNIEYIFQKPLTKIDYLFSDCTVLTSLDLSNFDTDCVINMSGLFNNCFFLKNLDLNNINTEEVIDMSRMFYNCKSLTKLDLSNFDTRNVTDMRDMFYNCIYIDNLNLSNFITNNVQNMSNMFNGCKSLVILNLSNFNVDKVTVMWKMFHGCIGLKDKNIRNKSLKLLNELKNIVFC